MKNTVRQERVSRMLFEELSIIVGSELSDPKLALARVTDVRISRDLRNAKVFVTHDDEEVPPKEVLWALKSATPYIRSQIAMRSTTRAVPEFVFHYDDSPERAERIDTLLAEIAAERGDAPQDDNASNGSGENEEADAPGTTEDSA